MKKILLISAFIILNIFLISAYAEVQDIEPNKTPEVNKKLDQNKKPIQNLINSKTPLTIFINKPNLVHNNEKIENLKINEYKKGDANKDGKVDIADAIYILGILNHDYPILDKSATDVNSDGQINKADTQFILDFLFNNGPSPSSFQEFSLNN